METPKEISGINIVTNLAVLDKIKLKIIKTIEKEYLKYEKGIEGIEGFDDNNLGEEIQNCLFISIGETFDLIENKLKKEFVTIINTFKGDCHKDYYKCD